MCPSSATCITSQSQQLRVWRCGAFKWTKIIRMLWGVELYTAVFFIPFSQIKQSIDSC